MTRSLQAHTYSIRTWSTRTWIALLSVLVALACSQLAWAQTGVTRGAGRATANDVPGPSGDDAEARAAEALAPPTPPVGESTPTAGQLPIWELFVRGGWLMLPIVLMSLIVVAIALERIVALRSSNTVPGRLARALRELTLDDSYDVRTAFDYCERRHSSLATVIKAMLIKVGRPHQEIEHAVAEASQREADRLYAPVRTLNLAAAITPLLGLLGTVWGMIQSFFVTANMPIGSNKGQVLAEGIYVALVTTFAGLAVAIPAAVLAHWFEGRILRICRDIQSLAEELLSHIERYEGKVRIDPRREARGHATRDTSHPVQANH